MRSTAGWSRRSAGAVSIDMMRSGVALRISCTTQEKEMGTALLWLHQAGGKSLDGISVHISFPGFFCFVFTLEISGTPGLAFLEASGNILGRPEIWSGRSLSLTKRSRVWGFLTKSFPSSCVPGV